MDRKYSKELEKIKEKVSDHGDKKYLCTIYPERSRELNVYTLVDVDRDGHPIIKFYDQNNSFLGIRNEEGRAIPSMQYSNENLGFLHEINFIYEKVGPSLEELDKKLEEASKILGVSKSSVLSMSYLELDQTIEMKDSFKPKKTEDDKIKIVPDEYDDDEEEQKQDQKQNKDILNNNAISMEEIDLNKKIDDRYTLADLLGIDPNAKLIVVNSTQIEDNVNTTRFSFLIEEADGTLRYADMLHQIGGKDSDKTVYETNNTGSQVRSKSVESSFGIDSELVENGILTVRIGQMGTIEVGYGQMDKTYHKEAFTQRLETDELYPTTAKVREEFSKTKGEYNISKKIDEIKEHEKHGCNMTIEDADGNLYTGHNHIEDVVRLITEDPEVRRGYL